ncbi:hypothetical protein [Verrucosispora sp. NA02020]|uniref:hypothetical protein n=1 Tax=Verrucosispora sp. NA02020 TaxID=2742132 RepID=UPI0015917D5E|nr:hypothetical protein [Verrucosispora sp. NA02020]QKW15426.1 hypothetical protein HUT12_23440 [Verrucosispora sp. NA02020]
MPSAADMPYRYFVSYAHSRGFGSIDIRSAQPADTYETVQEFRRTVAANSQLMESEIVILNYIPLSTNPTGTVYQRAERAESALRNLLGMVRQFDTPRDSGRVQAFVGDVRQVALRGLGDDRG